MKRSVFAATLIALFAGSAGAQQLDPQCAAFGGTTADVANARRDACQKAVDLFSYISPQLGTTIAGGNAILGQGGTLGGLPHFTVGLRANIVNGSLPNLDDARPRTAAVTPDVISTESQALAAPAIDVSVGVFGGLPVGVSRIGGIDLIASAAYVPEYQGENVGVSAPDGSLKLGYGARLGLLQESLTTPGLSVTWLRRDLPTLDIVGTSSASGGTDSLSVRGLDVETTAWRVVASKNFLVFGLALGVGQDAYKSNGTISYFVGNDLCAFGLAECSGSVDVDEKVTRTNYFANVYYNLMLAKIVAEVGQVSGGDITTYNEFTGKAADASRLYGSIGFRIGF